MAEKSFIEKIKEFFKKLKEENAGLVQTTKRINASGLCGTVNRGCKNGDFWEGSYVSIEGGHAVIYGSNQADYVFGAEDIESCTVGSATTASVGDKQHPAVQHTLVVKDGRTAYIDLINTAAANFKSTLKLL